MVINDIYQFFVQQPVTYLNCEQAVCYILSVLLEQGETYGTELIQLLESKYPNYRLSDTILYNALKFLETEAAIAGHWQKVVGRGRPRRMYSLCPQWRSEAEKLANLWEAASHIGGDRAFSTSEVRNLV